MGYEFHITRKDDWAGKGDEITAPEWLALVDSDPELRVTTEYPINGPYHVVWRGADPSESEWLDWEQGDIFTNHPTDSMIDKMVRIAAALKATVQGDEGEVYRSATDWSAPSE